MTFRVEFKPSAAKSLASLPKDSQRRIAARIDALARNPRPSGAQKIQGEASALRVRVGDYRVVYEVHEDVVLVLVLRVAHRRESHRQLSRL